MFQQKKMFKVLGVIPKHNNPKESYWVRMGSAFVNRDNSINIYLDACPSSFQLQLRELDEEDLRKRTQPIDAGPSPFPANALEAASRSDSPPF